MRAFPSVQLADCACSSRPSLAAIVPSHRVRGAPSFAILLGFPVRPSNLVKSSADEPRLAQYALLTQTQSNSSDKPDRLIKCRELPMMPITHTAAKKYALLELAVT